jgi:hypothetical protein
LVFSDFLWVIFSHRWSSVTLCGFLYPSTVITVFFLLNTFIQVLYYNIIQYGTALIIATLTQVNKCSVDVDGHILFFNRGWVFEDFSCVEKMHGNRTLQRASVKLMY